jgi:hypothetical protein
MAAEREDVDADLQAQVEAERASAEHWRDLAMRRSEALADLRGRPSVRAILRGERATRSVRRQVRGLAHRGTDSAGRLALSLAAVAARSSRSRRRQRLDAAVEIATAGDRPVVPTPPDVVLLDRDGRPRPASEVAEAIASASTPLVELVLTTTDHLTPHAGARLAAAVVGDVAMAAAVSVHPERPGRRATPFDLTVKAAGLATRMLDGVPTVEARGAGAPPDPTAPVESVPLALATSVVVERAALADAGGWPAVDDPDAAVAVACARLAARGRRIVVVPSVLAVDRRPVRSLAALRCPIDPGGPAWRSAVEHAGPALRRLAEPSPEPALLVTITVAAPSAKVAERWGDWHLATGLADALVRQGHRATVQTADLADGLAGRCADVHLVLRGLRAVRRTPGQRHVVWVISHPEAITVDEVAEADVVLVAAERFARHLRDLTTTPVEVFHQATDHHRFRPVAAWPGHRHDVLVVAKTRDVRRPLVDAAIAAGLRPAIYGSGWDDLVDPSLLVADHVDNDRLPALYAGAGVVLNDHWETMRAWGFVSNRLFDVLACGTPVVSDPVDGLEAIFGTIVPTATSAEQLRSVVDRLLADPAAAREVAGRGRRIVLDAHTFDHRASELVGLLERHGAC